MAEDAKESESGLTARVSAATEIEIELDEKDLELFAQCIKRSGKGTLRLTEAADPKSTFTGGGITKIVLD